MYHIPLYEELPFYLVCVVMYLSYWSVCCILYAYIQMAAKLLTFCISTGNQTHFVYFKFKVARSYFHFYLFRFPFLLWYIRYCFITSFSFQCQVSSARCSNSILFFVIKKCDLTYRHLFHSYKNNICWKIYILLPKWNFLASWLMAIVNEVHALTNLDHPFKKILFYITFFRLIYSVAFSFISVLTTPSTSGMFTMWFLFSCIEQNSTTIENQEYFTTPL